MKRYQVLLLTIILTPILAGIYGVLHDEFTYTISNEYFTKFKFYQFELADGGKEAILPNPRLAVAVVGFMATWWTGIFIGFGHALTGLIQKDAKTMLRVIIHATLITILTAIIVGLIGLVYGRFYLSNVGVNWWLPDNLVDKKSFIMVGSMHNFSYLGGVIGLIIGIIYQIIISKKVKNLTAKI